jgi:hypothetical protein
MVKLKATALKEKSCQQITELILDYLNDNLKPSIRRGFQDHLRICPDCVNFLNSYRKTIAATGSIRAEDIPVKVQRNILSFLKKRLRKLSFMILFVGHWLLN